MWKVFDAYKFMMNRNEKYLARIMFKLRIHESDGQAYEDLFVKIMTTYNTNFHPVKPHGNIGDRKNDGFDKTTGTYYQVFAPFNLQKDKTVTDAVNKLRNDFVGLKNYWDSICPIKEYYYVVNDKYHGVPSPIHEEIIALSNEYPKIAFDLFPVKKLEDIFINLSEDDIINIINFIPSDDIELIDYSILSETIKYILDRQDEFNFEDSLVVPDFDGKIKFNSLSPWVGHYLTTASYQNGDLEEYFAANSDFIREELKQKFRDLYEEAKEIIPDSSVDFSDQRFLYILKEASFNSTKNIRDAVLVLMAYYFESCDIFEEPPEGE